MVTQPARFPAQDGTSLCGEILLPAGDGAFPGTVMLHGASQGNREHYRALAEAFAEAGVACLIFDRRGCGESAGDAEMDLFLLGVDGAAAHDWLREQPRIDADRTGIWGYSNGAWVASIAARQAPATAFLVLTGAAGVSPGRAEAYRRAKDLESQGVASRTVRAVERAWTLIFEYLALAAPGTPPPGELAELGRVIQADRHLDTVAIPEFVRERPELDSIPRFDRPPLSEGLAALAGSMPDMGYDPVPVLGRLTCPTLIVLAELDANLPAAESRARFETVAATRPGVTIEMLAGARHTFAGPDLSEDWVAEHGLRREDYDLRYLEVQLAWLRSTVLAPSDAPSGS